MKCAGLIAFVLIAIAVITSTARPVSVRDAFRRLRASAREDPANLSLNSLHIHAEGLNGGNKEENVATISQSTVGDNFEDRRQGKQKKWMDYEEQYAHSEDDDNLAGEQEETSETKSRRIAKQKHETHVRRVGRKVTLGKGRREVYEKGERKVFTPPGFDHLTKKRKDRARRDWLEEEPEGALKLDKKYRYMHALHINLGYEIRMEAREHGIEMTVEQGLDAALQLDDIRDEARIRALLSRNSPISVSKYLNMYRSMEEETAGPSSFDRHHDTNQDQAHQQHHLGFHVPTQHRSERAVVPPSINNSSSYQHHQPPLPDSPYSSNQNPDHPHY
jgi:hypothetical protein